MIALLNWRVSELFRLQSSCVLILGDVGPILPSATASSHRLWLVHPLPRGSCSRAEHNDPLADRRLSSSAAQSSSLHETSFLLSATASTDRHCSVPTPPVGIQYEASGQSRQVFWHLLSSLRPQAGQYYQAPSLYLSRRQHGSTLNSE